MPTVVSSSFLGLDNISTGGDPPDSQGAVGPSSYVETVNQTVAIYSKTTGQPLSVKAGTNPDTLDDFFGTQGKLAPVSPPPPPSPPGSPPPPNPARFSDPVVTYDNLAGRFIIGDQNISDPGITGGTGAAVFDIAISKTSTPQSLTSADWNFYQIDTTKKDTNYDSTKSITNGDKPSNLPNFFTDYPGNLGYNADALVFTLNEFSYDGSSDFSLITTVSMSDLVGGVSQANLHSFQVNGPAGTLSIRPTAMHDSKAGDPMWMLAEGASNAIDVYKMTNLLSAPALGSPTSLTVNSYSTAVPLKQPDGSLIADQSDGHIDSRIQQAAEAGNILVAAQTISVSSTEDDVRWYELNVSSGTPVLQDQGNVPGGTVPGGTNNTYAAYPGIDINSQGDIGMSFMETGTAPGQFLSMWITGRTPSDPAGTMETPVLVQTGSKSYSDTNDRAGDLSGINVDADGSFWAVNEFANNDAAPNWGTAISHFTVGQAADLSVVDVGPPTVTAGGTATYTISVTNNGPTDAQTVNLTDTLPTGVTLFSETATTNPDNFSNTTSGSTPSFTATTMKAGATDVFQVVVKLPSNAAPFSILTNSATVTSSNTVPDPVTSNNTSAATSIVAASSDLSVTNVGPLTVTAGNTATYTIAVTNNGLSDAVFANLKDTLPTGVTLVSEQATSNPDNFSDTTSGNTPSFTAITMKAGSTDVFQVTVQVPPNFSGSSIPNTATVSIPGTDPNLANNTATVASTAITSADMEILSASGPSSITAGTNATYTIAIKNNGPSDAQNVTVSDALPTGLIFQATPASQLSGPDTFTLQGNNLVAATVAAGNTDVLQFFAHAPSGLLPTGNLLTDTANVTTTTTDPTIPVTAQVSSTLATSADLAVKVSSPPPAVEGDTLTYTLSVTNNGPSDAQNVVLTDVLSPDTALVSTNFGTAAVSSSGNTITVSLGALTAGNAVTGTIVVQTTEDGNLPNTATVSSATSDPVSANNTAQATTAVAEDAINLTAGASFNPTEFVALNNATLATFTHAQGVEPPSAFTALVSWGDGSTSSASVVQSGATYSVVASHTYNLEGSHSILVTVSEDGVSASATDGAFVQEAPLPAGFPQSIASSPAFDTIEDSLSQPMSVGQFLSIDTSLLSLLLQTTQTLMQQGQDPSQALSDVMGAIVVEKIDDLFHQPLSASQLQSLQAALADLYFATDQSMTQQGMSAEQALLESVYMNLVEFNLFATDLLNNGNSLDSAVSQMMSSLMGQTVDALDASTDV